MKWQCAAQHLQDCILQHDSVLVSTVRAALACLQGLTALHFAAYNGFPVIVKLLLLKGADVNAKDKFVGGSAGFWPPSLAHPDLHSFTHHFPL